MNTGSTSDIASMLIPVDMEWPAPLAFTQIALDETEAMQIAAHGLHKKRGKRGVPSWQDWCYLPVNVATGLLLSMEASGQRPYARESENRRTNFIHNFTCAASWTLGKGVYRLNHPYLEGLWANPRTADLPVSDLLALPEWCIYVECAGRVSVGSMPVEGFFAFLDDRFSPFERLWPELQIAALLRCEGYYLCLKYFVPLLRDKTLLQTLDLLALRAKANGVSPINEATLDLVAEDYATTVSAFANVVAFINGFCGEMKRLKAFQDLPHRKKIAFDANGLPMCEPQRHLWEVGDPSSAPVTAH